MKIKVKVNARSKTSSVTERADGMLCVKVDAPPVKGRANHRLIEILAAHFNVPKSAVTILHGPAAPVKLIEIKK